MVGPVAEDWTDARVPAFEKLSEAQARDRAYVAPAALREDHRHVERVRDVIIRREVVAKRRGRSARPVRVRLQPRGGASRLVARGPPVLEGRVREDCSDDGRKAVADEELLREVFRRA